MIELPPLPFDKTALQPHMSAETLSFHYGKHHRSYVEKTNKLIKGTKFEMMPLEEIIKHSAKDKQHKTLFNNAAQVWNHNFFWHSMTPDGAGKPEAGLMKRIETDFGSFTDFQSKFEEQGGAIFGTGWLWLILNDGKLDLLGTEDADTPLAHDVIPLICVDVWEHAYYLDYQNRRPDYLQAFLEHLINWDFAAHNLSTAIDHAA